MVLVSQMTVRGSVAPILTAQAQPVARVKIMHVWTQSAALMMTALMANVSMGLVWHVKMSAAQTPTAQLQIAAHVLLMHV